MAAAQENIEDHRKAVIVSLFYSDGSLGAAIYNQATTTVRILHDVAESDDYEALNLVFEDVEPTTVLACKSQDLIYVRYLQSRCASPEPLKVSTGKEARSPDAPPIYVPGILNQEVVPDSQDASSCLQEDDEDDFDPFKEAVLHLMPSNAFNFDQAVRRIGDLFSSEVITRSEADIVLHFRIDTNAKNMVCAFGALLRYMDATRIGVEYDALNIRTPISSVRTFIVDQMVEMDKSTYRALEIFGEDRKKEVGWKKVTSRTFKGVVSLFSLMNRCRSTLGKHTMMSWFRRPTLNKDTLRQRHKAISYFLLDCNVQTTSTIHQHIGRIRNIKQLLKRMRGSQLRPDHWNSLYESLKALLAIGRFLKERDIDLEIMKPYEEYFGNDLTELTFLIGYIIDFDESLTEGRLVANVGVDPDLDEIKQIYRNLPQLLTQAAQEEAMRLNARTCSAGYVPIVGYLLSLPLDFPAQYFPDLKMIYSTDDTVHMKSRGMDRLDEEVGDIRMQIIDKETTIGLRLQKSVLDKLDTILGSCKGAAILDVLISMSMTARCYNWNCPILVDKPVIEAVSSVHPLTQMRAKDGASYVPNPISFGGSETKIKIFTGPNACGKSVYMKQVAILVFLTYIGSFVPAQRAIVGPIARIMTRVYTVDGVLDGMSTFANDLSQLALALRRANNYSLVIIDEFGKGTLIETGIGLLAASLNYWLKKGSVACPFILVSSHFHSIPKYLVGAENNVSFQTFEVLKRGNRLYYQFRLISGLINCSHAAYTAAQCGIPPQTVTRSGETYVALRKGIPLAELDIDPQDQHMVDFLRKGMSGFLKEFRSWSVKDDCEGLLRRIREQLVEETEHMSLDVSTISVTPARVANTPRMEAEKAVQDINNNHLDEDVAVECVPESRETTPEESPQSHQMVQSSIADSGEGVTDPKSNDELFVAPETSIFSSILKNRYKPTPLPRGNLSVSFAASPVRAHPSSPSSSYGALNSQDLMQPVSPIQRFTELFPDESNDYFLPSAPKRKRR